MEKLTLQDLYERQNWSLDQKIDHSLGVIDQFIGRLKKRAYVSFSGGKDSCVLLHLAEKIKKDVPAIFFNTGCEYPSVIRFVNEMKADGHNIEVVKPKMTPKQVWEKYGFPLVSKDVASMIHDVRSNPNSDTAKRRMSKDNAYGIPEQWKFLVDEKFETSAMCCTKLKKEPSHMLAHTRLMRPMVGMLASESKMREKNVHQERRM